MNYFFRPIRRQKWRRPWDFAALPFREDEFLNLSSFVKLEIQTLSHLSRSAPGVFARTSPNSAGPIQSCCQPPRHSTKVQQNHEVRQDRPTPSERHAKAWCHLRHAHKGKNGASPLGEASVENPWVSSAVDWMHIHILLNNISQLSSLHSQLHITLWFKCWPIHQVSPSKQH